MHYQFDKQHKVGVYFGILEVFWEKSSLCKHKNYAKKVNDRVCDARL